MLSLGKFSLNCSFVYFVLLSPGRLFVEDSIHDEYVQKIVS